MKPLVVSAFIAFAGLGLFSTPAFCQNQPTTEPAVAQNSEPADPDVAIGGSIDRETSAGTRDLTQQIARGYVLSPIKRTAVTHSASPKLVFYLDAPTDLEVVVEIRERSSVSGIGEMPLEWSSDKVSLPSMSPGLHILDLSACGATLRPGVIYRWTVAVVPDQGDKSTQNESWGLIWFKPSGDGTPSFYDDLAQAYTALLSNPSDVAAHNRLQQLMLDQNIDYVKNLTLNPAEPAAPPTSGNQTK
jgi:hypothetical protein